MASTSTNSTATSDSPFESCTTAVPGKYGYVPVTACNSNYNYDPSFSAAVAVSVIFGILTTAHLAEAILFRKSYAWVVVMGALWETLAFIMGALGAHDQQNSGYATAHTLLFLLAPLWVNGFIYMTFARMVHFFLPDKRIWIFQATGMSKWFVWADVLSFIVQAAGGIMSSPGGSSETIQIGLHIYTGGVAMQELFILCFLGLMVMFHRKTLKLNKYIAKESSTVSKAPKRLTSLLYTLYTVLAFISLRIFYRIAEFGGGLSPTSNPVPYHEAYSYALDAFPMMICLVLLVFMHPGRALVGSDSEFPKKSRADKKAEKKAKFESAQMTA